MKEKTELLMEFQFIFYSNSENVAERNIKFMQFFFLENC
jgi:hypothetical protein